MKTCSRQREIATLLACGTLASPEAAEARAHLEICASCREYLRQISAVCEDHRVAAQQLPAAVVSPRLRNRIAASVQADNGRARGKRSYVPFDSGQWSRIAGAAALVVILVASWLMLRRPTIVESVARLPLDPPVVKAHLQTGNINLITYRLALNRSPEDLERLLADQAERPASNPTPTLRPSLARLELTSLELYRRD